MPFAVCGLKAPLCKGSWRAAPEGLSHSVCDPIFFRRKRCRAAKRTLMVPAPPQLSPLHCRSRSKSGGKMVPGRRWWSLYRSYSFRTMEHGFATLAPQKRRRPGTHSAPLEGSWPQSGLKGVSPSADWVTLPPRCARHLPSRGGESLNRCGLVFHCLP